jgi:hypothetical protein
MTHSAIGSYCSSLGEMFCLLSAVAEFPPSLNAWYKNYPHINNWQKFIDKTQIKNKKI